MINRQTLKQLLIRLPLLYTELSEVDYKILLEKWGGSDGEYHSSKSIIKRLQPKHTETEIRELEQNAIGRIDAVIEGIFTCKSCKVDVRKCGVRTHVTGVRKGMLYISADGTPARNQHMRFSKYKYGNTKQEFFYCGNCDVEIKDNQGMSVILGKKLNNDNVRAFLTAYYGVDWKKIPKPTDVGSDMYKEVEDIYETDDIF